MGGRGQRSPLLDNPMNPIWSSGNLGPKIGSNLKEALGERGAPLSIGVATAGANPNFSPEYREYSMNCQRCVVAYEMRRRGYDVTALYTFKDDRQPRTYVGQNGIFYGAFRHAKVERVGGPRVKSTIRNIESKMSGFGDGSRAIIEVQWRGKKSGHVFSVENHHGKTVYVDAQTGKKVSINNYLNHARLNSVKITRTDNLRPSYRMREMVIPNRKK